MRGFNHLRQCLQYLPLGVVDVPQKMREQLIQGRVHGLGPRGFGLGFRVGWRSGQSRVPIALFAAKGRGGTSNECPDQHRQTGVDR